MARRRKDAAGRGAARKKPTVRKKPAERRVSPPEPPELPRERIELAVLALVRGGTHEQVAAILVNKGMEQTIADAVVNEAVDRIALAADFKRRHELGLAIQQLRDVYANAMKVGKPFPAIMARKELNKLLALYDVDPMEIAGAAAHESATAQAMALIDGHLRQVVGLCVDIPDDFPITEIARIAADIVRSTID